MESPWKNWPEVANANYNRVKVTESETVAIPPAACVCTRVSNMELSARSTALLSLNRYILVMLY